MPQHRTIGRDRTHQRALPPAATSTHDRPAMVEDVTERTPLGRMQWPIRQRDRPIGKPQVGVLGRRSRIVRVKGRVDTTNQNVLTS